MIRAICLVLLASAVAVIGDTATLLIEKGDDWRYLDDGSDQGTAWRTVGYIETGWSGPSPAQLGYGDFDEATLIDFGPDSTNKYVTTYFRKTMILPNGSAFKFLELDLLRDDGAVVYVNGTEVWRDNMPAGPINYLTLASSIVDGSDEDVFIHLTVPPTGLFVDGTNVIAVEIHQSSVGSSDISFDFEAAAVTNDLLVTRGSIWRYLDDGSNQGTNWQATGFNDTAWSSGPAVLGYGDDDIVTEVGFGGVSSAKFITTYFRQSFVVGDASEILFLCMRLRRDDGAAVYLNGYEVWRNNLPGGTIDYLTTASAALDGSAEDIYLDKIIGADTVLMDGANTFAVEIHQSGPTSSDVIFDFSCEAITNDIPPLVRGPYLQSGTHTSAVVCWRTLIGTESWVCYGDSPTNMMATNIVTDLETDHFVVITNLLPNTQYYYAIGDDEFFYSGPDIDHSWITHPVPGTIQPLRFWFLGDSGEANLTAVNVSDAYYGWSGGVDPDVWVMLGDNAYNWGTDDEYQAAVFETYPDTLKRVFLWPTLGNHDAVSASSSSEDGPYYDIFQLPENAEAGGTPSNTEAWYSFDYGNVHLICLNSQDVDRSTNGAMYGWLETDLMMTDKDWIIAFFHHPPYTKGSHNSDSFSDSGGRLFDMREVFLPLLESHGVDLVLAGHSHAYERSIFLNGHYGLSGTLTNTMVIDSGSGRGDGTGPFYNKAADNAAVYVVAGSSSKATGGTLDHPAMYFSTNDVGSLVIDVSSNKLDGTFIGDTPTVHDWFTITKNVTGYELTTSTGGSGTVVPGGGVFSGGTVLELAALPDTFFEFSEWSGDLIGTKNPERIFMGSDLTITGTFAAIVVTNNVPQWWLHQHGLALTDAAALADQDMDGDKTWEEFIADTVPTDGESVLQITGITLGNPTRIDFGPGSTGRVYTLQAASDSGSVYTNVPGQADVPGRGGQESLFDDAGTSSSRTWPAYRIEAEVP
jgi:hypothetical protein